MNKKLLYSLVLFFAIIIFAVSYTFAANDNSMLGDAANGIRNFVGDAENTVENAAKDVSNASKDATGDMEQAGNNAGNDMTSNQENGNNARANNGNNGSDEYTATRTSTDTTANTFMGMTANAWTWLILGIVAIAIIALVWYYSAQIRSSDYDHKD